jgi:hypothetical protein
MSKRTNSFPTFTPSTKTEPPTAGFQPANIILSSQVNGAVYMSYNFVNSFVNALIDMGSLDDSAIYSYADTNLATKIEADFNGWFNNRINSYNFTKIEISEQVDDYAELTINGLSISNSDRLSSTLTYEQLSFTNDQKSLTMMADHLSWNDGNGTSSYLNLADLTYLVNNTTINFLPSTIKSSTSTQTLKCVYAKEFLTSSYSTYADLQSAVTSFITGNHGELTILNIVASATTQNEDITLVTRKYGGVLLYFYLVPEKASSTSTYTVSWTLLENFANISPDKITVQFC